MTFFKAVRPDGTSFYDPNFRWLPDDGVIPDGGHVVYHPFATELDPLDPAHYLSVSTVATDCVSASWPLRLLEVEPVAGFEVASDSVFVHKRCSIAWRVVRELEATEALGPQGVQVAAIIDAAKHLVDWQHYALVYQPNPALHHPPYSLALKSGRQSAYMTVTYAAGWRGGATEAAIGAVLVRDLLASDDYDECVAGWESVMGTRWTR